MSTADSVSHASTDPRLALPPGSTEERKELVARMGVDLPCQGEWTADEYLDHTGCGVEFDNGFLEFTEMPDGPHNHLIFLLAVQLKEILGFRNVQLEAFRLWIHETRYREPDVMATITGHGWDTRRATAADLVIEVVSESWADRQRDLVEKRADYERAGIPEYWIVDPLEKAIIVLTLPEEQKHYIEHGVFKLGETATSIIVPTFAVDVTDAFTKAGVIEEGD